MTNLEPAAEASPHGWSWEFGQYFGISLRIHVSFAILLGWLAYATYTNTGSVYATTYALILMSALFACVAMHEYGHALMARRFGIGTREITLFPIGGIAQLERIPEDPRQEFWIAVAGPAVNVVLALIFGALIWAQTDALAPVVSDGWMHGTILSTLFRVNVVMAVFNMLPALPMDGGRVLRSLLALRMPHLKATRVSTRIAKFFAGGMMLFGVSGGNLLLSIIGLFVWMAGNAEYRRVLIEEAYKRSRHGGGRAGSFWADFARPDAPGTAAGGGDPPGEWINPPPSVRPKRR